MAIRFSVVGTQILSFVGAVRRSSKVAAFQDCSSHDASTSIHRRPSTTACDAGRAAAAACDAQRAGQSWRGTWPRSRPRSAAGSASPCSTPAIGRRDGHRLDERFPMCSTFKWLAAALVLRRVDEGEERLERRIRFGRDALVPLFPGDREARRRRRHDAWRSCARPTVTLSDNTAANLILRQLRRPGRR